MAAESFGPEGLPEHWIAKITPMVDTARESEIRSASGRVFRRRSTDLGATRVRQLIEQEGASVGLTGYGLGVAWVARAHTDDAWRKVKGNFKRRRDRSDADRARELLHAEEWRSENGDEETLVLLVISH